MVGIGQRAVQRNSGSFGKELENLARAVVEEAELGNGVAAAVRSDIALALDHLERIRTVREGVIESLLQVECYIGTELLQMKQRSPRYSFYHFPEREKLHQRLQRLEEERRRMALLHDDRIQRLQLRLSGLLTKHLHLIPRRQ